MADAVDEVWELFLVMLSNTCVSLETSIGNYIELLHQGRFIESEVIMGIWRF